MIYFLCFHFYFSFLYNKILSLLFYFRNTCCIYFFILKFFENFLLHRGKACSDLTIKAGLNLDAYSHQQGDLRTTSYRSFWNTTCVPGGKA